MDDVREDQERTEVHEAIAAEQELTDAVVDDWYASLEEIDIWADFWKDHKDNA